MAALWAACLPAPVLVASVPLVRRIEAVALSELLEMHVRDRADRLYLWAPARTSCSWMSACRTWTGSSRPGSSSKGRNP
ncbi:hypothetical protein FHR32_001258 [Streptosporangium album]|uniref:Uncharacterized protein n=1 Tax=Streptosporangium album TaxID=47479 RepID=A0A7W7RST9_9ACTN|nr:hypothetical protein [Streptosporangium album]MBB4936953.1 hypothetical protein [Streptosporangium album]